MEKIKKFWSSSMGIGLFFAIVSIVSFYFFNQKNVIYYADDLWFHLERYEYWYELFSSSQFYNYGNFYSYSQVGVTVDIFYPFLTYMPIAFIRIIVTSPILTWYIFWGINFWITLYLTYWVGKSIWKRQDTALLFSLFYSFSAYRLFNVLIRSAVGEALAMTFLPLVIYGIYKLINQEKNAWIPLSFGMVLVAYSHILSTVIISIFLVLICAMNYKVFLKKEPWIELIKAIAVFLFLIAIVILPMLEQFMTLGVVSANLTPILNETKQSLLNLILLSSKNTIAHASLGTMVMGILLVAPLFYKKLSFHIKQLLILSWITIIFMCFMDFDLLQNTSFATIQFIWRFNFIITLFATFIFGEVIQNMILIIRKEWFSYLVGIIILFIGFFSLFRIYNYFQENPYELPILDEYWYERQIKTGTVSDYLSEETTESFYSIKNKEIRSTSEIVKVDVASEKNRLIFDIEAKGEGEVDTYVPYYIGMKVFSEDKEVDFDLSPRGTVQFNINEKNQEFIVLYEWTLTQKIAWIITWSSWLGVLVYFSVKIYNDRKTELK